MRRYLGPVVLAILALLALWFLQQRDDPGTAVAPPAASTGTSATPPHRPVTREPSASSTTAPRRSPGPSTTPAPAPINPVEPTGEAVDPTAPATPRDETQAARYAAYGKAAESFMGDFARPPTGVSEQQWWSNVTRHLSEDAASAYEGTDPQNVPFSKVTSGATIVPSEAPDELLAVARIRTDAGWYLVELTRTEAGIRVTRATPEAATR